MKKNRVAIFIAIVGAAILLQSCGPQIYGQTKRKRIKDCGCELYPYLEYQKDEDKVRLTHS